MKKSLIIPIIFACATFAGCSSTPETTTTPVPSVPQPTEPQQAPQPQPQAVLPADLQWKSYYLDRKKDDIKDLYDRAKKLVEEQRNVTGELNPWGFYFGSWVVIIFNAKKSELDEIVLDAPPPVNPAFLVDMNAGQVIAPGDWKSARPFIEALIAAYRRGFDKDKDRQKFLNYFASSASVIAFGDTDYLEEPDNYSNYPKSVTGPRFKYAPEKSELTYFLMSHGMVRAFTKCTLTITPAAIIYNSEQVGLE